MTTPPSSLNRENWADFPTDAPHLTSPFSPSKAIPSALEALNSSLSPCDNPPLFRNLPPLRFMDMDDPMFCGPQEAQLSLSPKNSNPPNQPSAACAPTSNALLPQTRPQAAFKIIKNLPDDPAFKELINTLSSKVAWNIAKIAIFECLTKGSDLITSEQLLDDLLKKGGDCVDGLFLGNFSDAFQDQRFAPFNAPKCISELEQLLENLQEKSTILEFFSQENPPLAPLSSGSYVPSATARICFPSKWSPMWEVSQRYFSALSSTVPLSGLSAPSFVPRESSSGERANRKRTADGAGLLHLKPTNKKPKSSAALAEEDSHSIQTVLRPRLENCRDFVKSLTAVSNFKMTPPQAKNIKKVIRQLIFQILMSNFNSDSIGELIEKIKNRDNLHIFETAHSNFMTAMRRLGLDKQGFCGISIGGGPIKYEMGASKQLAEDFPEIHRFVGELRFSSYVSEQFEDYGISTQSIETRLRLFGLPSSEPPSMSSSSLMAPPPSVLPSGSSSSSSAPTQTSSSYSSSSSSSTTYPTDQQHTETT